jgi:hypothetical protein
MLGSGFGHSGRADTKRECKEATMTRAIVCNVAALAILAAAVAPAAAAVKPAALGASLHSGDVVLVAQRKGGKKRGGMGEPQ